MINSNMSEQEYTLEEISYSRKEDCRIMEAVLREWFKNPKILNFVDPTLSYPFQFKKWAKLKYTSGQDILRTIVLKKGNWIIGHLSLCLDEGYAHMFHLFIDSDYRRKGLGKRMVLDMENYASKIGYKTFRLNILLKNNAALQLYDSLGYEKEEKQISGSIKMLKRIE